MPPTPRVRLAKTVLLAVVFAASLAAFFGLGEISARLVMPQQMMDSCVDPAGRVSPLCHSRTKLAEGAWVDNHYNECGYRSQTSCRGVAPDGERVVMMGSSISNGYGVAQDASIGAQTALRLEWSCRRPIDVQSMNFYLPTHPDPAFWAGIDNKLAQVRAMSPKVVVLTVSSFDLASYQPEASDAAAAPALPPPPQGLAAKSIAFARATVTKIRRARDESRLVLAARRLAFKDPKTFLQLYLSNADDSGYMRERYSPQWRARLALLDATVAKLAAELDHDGVELVLLYVPFAATPTMLARNIEEPGVDPWAFDRQIIELGRRHGARVAPATRRLSEEPNPMGLYYVVNGHPNAKGDEVVAEALADTLSPILHCPSRQIMPVGIASDHSVWSGD